MVGSGYAGSRLAAELAQSGCAVTAATRTSAVEIQGVESVHVDLDRVVRGRGLDCDHAIVYYLVPPPREGIADSRVATFTRDVISGSPEKFVLISTTGVYGDCGGAWVDETAPLNPATDRARRRVDSEAKCRSWAQAAGIELVILRVPAIYGPTRVPTRRLREGVVLPPRQQCGYTNRIHVDDLVQICRLAGESKTCGTFNVSDGTPMRMIDYFDLVAEIWSLNKPATSPSATDGLSSAMAEYLRDSRKIDNTRMMEELKPNLAYSDARAGLMMCFESDCAANAESA